MKRPMLAIGLSWFFATWLAFFCGSTALQISFAALMTALLFFVLRQKLKYAYAACIIMLAAAVAFAAFWMHEKRRVEPLLALAGKTVTAEGLITETDYGVRSVNYTVKASFTEYPGLPETTLIVRDFSGMERNAGDTVRFDVKLTQAPASAWYRSRGILLAGQSPENVESIPVGKYRFERALMRLRVILSRNAYANLEKENADIVSAMVLGLKNNVSPEVYSALGKSGTSHLLAVSGLHLSIISAAVLAALKKLKCPRTLAAFITLVFDFLFSVLVGFSASVFRAFVMTAMALLAECAFSRRNDSLSSLGCALLICGIIWPHWALGWGIWLSAGSTLGIILYGSKLSSLLLEKFGQIKRIQRRFAVYISNALGISVAAYAFTIPLLFLMSGWVSLVSPLANLLISPFVSVAIFFGAVCAFLPPAAPMAGFAAAAANVSTAFIVKVSEALGSLGFATFAIDESWVLIFLSGACAMLAVLILYRADKRLVAYAAALIAVCFFVGDLSLATANRGKIELVTLEDRNSAVLLRGGEAVILGTPDAYEIPNLLRYLTFRGVRSIPAVIATDSPDNVSSGLLRLAQEYDIDCVIAPNDAYVEESLARALPGSIVYSGGYAEITVLGGAKIRPDLSGRNIHIQIGENEIVKIRREYDIMESESRILVFDGGKMLLPKQVSLLFEPSGAFLFGESRIVISS